MTKFSLQRKTSFFLRTQWNFSNKTGGEDYAFFLNEILVSSKWGVCLFEASCSV